MPASSQRLPAVVHVDLDGGRDVFGAHGWTYGLEGDPLFASGLANLLDFLDAERVRAVLFLIARDLDDPAKRALVENAVRRGHEIGSHSLTHSHLSTLDPAGKRREVAESRARIEAELGVSVRGFRASGFDLDGESLALLADSGYAFDSSLFPTRASARRAGLASVPPAPHRPLAGRDLLELPLPAHAPLPFPFHPSYSLVLGSWWFRLGLSRARGAPLVLLFHLTDFADPLPESALRGARSRVYTIAHLSARAKRERCARMLALVRARFELTTTDSLLV